MMVRRVLFGLLLLYGVWKFFHVVPPERAALTYFAFGALLMNIVREFLSTFR